MGKEAVLIRIRDLNRQFKKSMILTIFIIFPTIIISSFIYHYQLVEQENHDIQHNLELSGQSLQLSVNEKFSHLSALKAYVEINMTEEFLNQTFDPFISQLYETTVGIRNFGIAPAGVQTYVYPLEGNEGVIGHDLLADERPSVQEDVGRMLTQQSIAISGPYELRQGGWGLVAREPIYTLGGDFWGIISMVADLQPILDEAEFENLTDHVDIAVRNWRDDVFYGNPNIFTQNHLNYQITLPEFYWEIGGIPTESARQRMQLDLIQFTLIVSIIGLSIIVISYLTWNQQERIKKELDRQSKRLEELNQERLEFERTLMESKKTESLGVLVSGIAHDFNNLLQIIRGNLNLISQESENQNTLSQLEIVDNEIESASMLIEQLQSYTGKSPQVFTTFSLNQLIKDTMGLFSITIPKSIHHEYHLAIDNTNITGDKTQIKQLILNLLINSVEAKPKQIIITTETINVDYKKDKNSKLNLAEGRYVKFACKDDGAGISQENISKIFDPFFSTKGFGRGLGLSTAFGVVKSHSGVISIESQPNQGTSFIIYFPISNQNSTETNQLMNNKNESRHFEGQVLLCDDEAAILRSLGIMLEKFGFSVLKANDGYESFEKFQAHANELKLIILDIMMPGPDGIEVLQKVREIDKKIKIILISGFSQDRIDLSEDPHTKFLTKPFTFHELQSLISELL